MDLETVNQYFTLPYQLLYLIIILTVGTLWSLRSWSEKCRNHVKVFVVKAVGGCDTVYAPKSGSSSVVLINPKTKTAKVWPINKLATIETDYPGDGLVPKFLQRRITTTIVDETDWEPILNRGSYSSNVASPDVISWINMLANDIEDANFAESLRQYAGSLSTAPTREMIASPEVFGNLIMEKVSEALLTVNKETLDAVAGLVKRMNDVVSTTKLYVCTAVIILAVSIAAYISYQQQQRVDEIYTEIQTIENALGIVRVTANLSQIPDDGKRKSILEGIIGK